MIVNKLEANLLILYYLVGKYLVWNKSAVNFYPYFLLQPYFLPVPFSTSHWQISKERICCLQVLSCSFIDPEVWNDPAARPLFGFSLKTSLVRTCVTESLCDDIYDPGKRERSFDLFINANKFQPIVILRKWDEQHVSSKIAHSV